MLQYLNGTLAQTGLNHAVIDCCGVGFLCTCSANTLRKLNSVGSKQKLLTHMNVREDVMELYGFADEAERDCFRLLITVSGVGPKVAVAILSGMSPEEFSYAVMAGDARALQQAPGIGARLAQRLITELKGKLGDLPGIGAADAGGAQPAAGKANEAVAALCALGYTRAEAQHAITGLDVQGLELEQLIKAGLTALTRSL